MDSHSQDAFVFMKVGRHANEPFEEILARKRREFECTGRTFWGYGGTACHPLRQVQPFARARLKKQGGIYVFFEPINSNADPDLMPAQEYSADGIHWAPIPDGINVTGSRYALVLDEIKPSDLDLQFEDYSVAVGPSRGKAASRYVSGHVDKGCLELASERDPLSGESRPHKIEYTAQLLQPYAVLLR